MNKKGLLIVISGPSGAGKGTVYNEVLIRRPEIQRSVSVTTRAPRKGEVDGIHYYFRTVEEYQRMIADGEFLETASVYSNYFFHFAFINNSSFTACFKNTAYKIKFLLRHLAVLCQRRSSLI